ncbi:cation diffusion facilitator family transporter [Oecophyllibacter saccharovorans]|uniref:Cation transporter n=1 Tax=Oecophyllibacter saccharovorans TaxID=2558360 RepID=A0A506ULV6_9PROT|nr:cation diffusion facilitator family transporter [Oecophyllibacter saccharovorans]TPW34308.1 cation transporter [Oecophyllibacter saccharovorans]
MPDHSSCAAHATSHTHASPSPGHGHGHAHAHGAGGHHHAPATFGRVFAIGITLNTLYILAETAWGFKVHSLSLLADAGHNFSDVLGLVAAWVAQVLARRAPTPRYTYGLKRATILSALANATFLLLVTGALLWEAVQHLFHPVVVGGEAVSLVALVGIAVNGFTALLFMRGAKEDLNMRGAFLHMASDAAMALAVVIAGALIAFTGWNIIDPIMSILVSLAVVWGTWSLLTQSLRLALDGVPVGINPLEVEEGLRALSGVRGLHHLHIWPMSTTETALTVHLNVDPVLMDPASPQGISALLARARAMLAEKYGIQHPTLQIETTDAPNSADAPSRCAAMTGAHEAGASGSSAGCGAH